MFYGSLHNFPNRDKHEPMRQEVFFLFCAVSSRVRKVEVMAELKWYGIFVVLFGTILSIADPITDILTLVEFYRTDHKTWFGVGLTFLILPSFFFLIVNFALEFSREDEQSEQEECTAWKCTHASFLGCNPLYPAWLKLQTLFFYLKVLLKPRQRINDQTSKDFEHVLGWSKYAVLVEAALESAPQFIIQLYAMAVQQQSVSIVQMVSLPVSFLSMTWASVVADEALHCNEGDLNFSVQDRVLQFVTYLFILSSRLFAVALFTVSYKWWVTSVLILHCAVMVLCDTVCQKGSLECGIKFISVLVSCIHWLRDDLSMITVMTDTENEITKHVRRMQLVSNLLFVIENITMILLFYFSHFPHTWYSLPVTICVCLFAVLGAVMRLTHFYFLYEDSDDEDSDDEDSDDEDSADQSNNTDQVQQQWHSNLVQVAATFNGGKS